MKKFVVLGVALALVGCSETSDSKAPSTGAEDYSQSFKPICIDGVQYWFSRGWGNASVMSPRISPKTGKYMSCPVMVAPVATEIEPTASEGID